MSKNNVRKINIGENLEVIDTQKKSKTSKVGLTIFLSLISIVLVAGGIFLFKHFSENELKSQIKKEVFIEYGTVLTPDLFIADGATGTDIKFESDISVIDTDIIATYKILLSNKGQKAYSVLNIVDTTAPVAEAVPQRIYLHRLPDPTDCVTNIVEHSEYTINYVDGADAETPGDVIIGVKITDKYNNETVIDVPFTVIYDDKAPIISGAKDIEYIMGDIVLFKQGVTVADDYDENPTLEVDNSEVDLTKEGQYPLRYIATDEYGNVRTVTVTVTVLDPEKLETDDDGNVTTPSGHKIHYVPYDESVEVSAEDAYRLARNVYGSICNSSMSDVKKGLKIFYWVNHNIALGGRKSADKRSWATAAVKAFTVRYSSCYGQWACCKALLDIAGIPNMKVWRTGSDRVHVWCLCYLNGQWYHCDATQWPGCGHYFAYMMTDAEIQRAPGNHRFLKSRLPERATKSVQKYIDIYSCNVSNKLVLVTPTPTPTPTETPTPTPTPIPTDTPVPTATPKLTATPVPTAATEPTKAPVPTATAVPTKAPTKAPIVTSTPVPTKALLPTSTPVAKPTAVPTEKPVATIEPTKAPTPTEVPPTPTPVPTETPETEPEETNEEE